MKVFNEDKKCFRDEFNRPKSDIEYRFGSDDDDNYFVNADDTYDTVFQTINGFALSGQRTPGWTYE